LQVDALKVWGGKDVNIEAARVVFVYCVKMNVLASVGKWSKALEN